ncbi:MAG TPA: methyltransferase domain-containing protein [Nitrososphaera sp.]|nr:methyltransferase domain-containing protein [Nitrososphaera sp.]
MDPEKFKSMQRQGWDGVSEAWKKWWPVIEESTQVVSDRLVDLAGIRQGSRVLDIATGIGEPAITAARKAGPTGKVTAIDMSPEMLALAMQRAKDVGITNIEFREADAESLQLASTFDAVLSRFGLMFMPNLLLALKIMRNALAENGRISAAVWSTADKVPAFLLPLEIIMKETGSKPPPPGTPGPFSLGDTNLLRQKFEQADFQDVMIEKNTMNFRFPSTERYVDMIRSTSGQLLAMMAGLPAERHEEVWNKVADGARKHLDPDTGTVNFTNEVVYVTARH